MEGGGGNAIRSPCLLMTRRDDGSWRVCEMCVSGGGWRHDGLSGRTSHPRESPTRGERSERGVRTRGRLGPFTLGGGVRGIEMRGVVLMEVGEGVEDLDGEVLRTGDR